LRRKNAHTGKHAKRSRGRFKALFLLKKIKKVLVATSGGGGNGRSRSTGKEGRKGKMA